MKLTKKELLEQLSEIESQEILDRNEKFYNMYKDMSFFQIFKNIGRWKLIIGILIIVETICLFDTKTMIGIMLILPVIIFLLPVTAVLEIKQRVKYMSKNMEK